MKHLFSEWQKIDFHNFRGIYLFLDYDGTICPLSKETYHPVLSPAMKDMLVKLNRKPYLKVALISGRSIRDLKEKIGLRSLVYSGNHGLEISGPGIRFESPVKSGHKKMMDELILKFREQFSDIPGLLVNDKGLSVSLHYRFTTPAQKKRIHRTYMEIIHPFLSTGKITVFPGKKIHEVKPNVLWNKGNAVEWLLNHETEKNNAVPLLPVYLGDDVTDEDAFRILLDKGITVRIGRAGGVSHARYFLRNIAEVLSFFKRLEKMKLY